MSFSPALSFSYLQEKYQIRPLSYELTTVVRQEAENGILELATDLRKKLADKRRSTFMIPENLNHVFQINPNQVIQRYLDNIRDGNLNSSVVINHSNKKCLDINKEIRHIIFPGSPSVANGDLIIIHQNNYKYSVELLNGMIVKVISVSGPPIVKSNMLSYNEKGEEVFVTHTFLPVVIEVEESSGQKVQVHCMLLENFLHTSSPALSYEESVALFIDFKMRYPDLKPKTTAFKDVLRSDKFFNAIRAKFAYAITCHKAQGGEWQKAVVNLDVSMGKLSDHFLRWTYTAVTRARSELSLFNVPHQDQFVKLSFESGKLPNVGGVAIPAQEVLKVVLPENFEGLKVGLGLKDTKPFLLQKFIDLFVLGTKYGFEITGRQSKQHHELYNFKREEKIASVAFYYNKDEKFTRNVYQKGSEDFLTDLKEYFSAPVHYQVVSGKSSTDSPEELPKTVLEEGENDKLYKGIPEHLAPLYEQMLPLLNPYGITISDIEHEQYAEKYFFSRREEKACLQFYYNVNFQFTDVITHITKCNSQILLDDIYSVIKILKN